MTDVLRRSTSAVAVLAAIATLGCTEPGGRTALGPTSPSARREEWRRRIQWSDQCERAFSKREDRSVGNGVRVLKMSNGAQLMEIRCDEGAYQPSQVFAALSPEGRPTALAAVPVMILRDEGIAWGTAEEVSGTVTFEPRSGQVTIVNVSRGVGDCGSLVVYAVDIDSAVNFRVMSARAKYCDDLSLAPSSWPLVR